MYTKYILKIIDSFKRYSNNIRYGMANIFIYKCDNCNHYNKVRIDINQLNNGIPTHCVNCRAPYLIKKRIQSNKILGGVLAGGITGGAIGGLPGAIIGGLIGAGLGATDSTKAVSHSENENKE